jgi:hypothetical protein
LYWLGWQISRLADLAMQSDDKLELLARWSQPDFCRTTSTVVARPSFNPRYRQMFCCASLLGQVNWLQNVSGMRLDAQLYNFVSARKFSQIGRPRVRGERCDNDSLVQK